MDTPIIAAIIHPNGDRPETLSGALRQAYRAIRAAILALRETAPNARNYYVQPGLFEQARVQYQARVEALMDVCAALVAEHRAIEAQGKHR